MGFLDEKVPQRQDFPALKIGAIAGISAALTIAALVLLLWLGSLAVHAVESSAASARAAEIDKQQAVISPEFASKFRALLDAMDSERAAAPLGKAKFDRAREIAGTAADALSASDLAEANLRASAVGDEYKYASCVDLTYESFPVYKLTECEKNAPSSAISELRGKVASIK